MTEERFCYHIYRAGKGKYIKWMNISEFVVFLNNVNIDCTCTIVHQPYKYSVKLLKYADIKKCYQGIYEIILITEDEKIDVFKNSNNSITAIYCDEVN